LRTRLYIEVQQFYARQMRLLDIHDIDSHAKTFTEDATFEHLPGFGPVSTRAAIGEAMLRWDRRSGDPIQRRHCLSMLDLMPRRGGLIDASSYLIEFTIRPGAKPQIAQSCTVNDELTRVGGQLLVRSRKVLEDRL
jgi:actinorhodin biosynthesis protein ActVIA